MANVSHVKIDNDVYDISPATPPSVGNGTLTIQKNGTNVQTFTANQSSNATANITVPTKVSELTNDSGYTTNIGTVTQVKVGTTAYNPSSGVVSLPAYPTVNNATLTIQKNGSNVQTFTANQSSNATANITVPTKTSELTNDSGYITNAGVTGVKGNSESSYRTGNVNLTAANIGAAASNHTHATSIATSSGTNQLTMAANTKYALTAGGTSYVFTTPPNPSIGNGTLTIQRNGTNVTTFTANQSGNATANITVPTKTSQLTNDSNFIASTSTVLNPATVVVNANVAQNSGIVACNIPYHARGATLTVLTPLGYSSTFSVSIGASYVGSGACWFNVTDSSKLSIIRQYPTLAQINLTY